MFLITDTPKTHPFITSREKEYLIEETKKAVAAKEKGLVTFFINLICVYFDKMSTCFI